MLPRFAIGRGGFFGISPGNHRATHIRLSFQAGAEALWLAKRSAKRFAKPQSPLLT